MFQTVEAFSSFSVQDLAEAQMFYQETVGLAVTQDNRMGLLELELPKGAKVMIYPKADHQPAAYTVLNLVVEDLEAVVDELVQRGVTFEHYDEGPVKTDAKGIARGKAAGMGPDIAWFRDPAGNILSVIGREDSAD